MKNILITGASRGIGKKIALDLASKNTHLILVSRSKNDLIGLKTELDLLNLSSEIHVGSVSDFEFIENLNKLLINSKKNVDVLINNAGIGFFDSFEKINHKQIQEMIHTNIFGSIFLTQKCIETMKLKKEGQIINIISDAGKRTFENGTVYCATKHAQEGLFTALRKEVRRFNIKISNIYPGLVDTFFNNNIQGHFSQKDYLPVDQISKAVQYILSLDNSTVLDEIIIHPIKQEY